MLFRSNENITENFIKGRGQEEKLKENADKKWEGGGVGIRSTKEDGSCKEMKETSL